MIYLKSVTAGIGFLILSALTLVVGYLAYFAVRFHAYPWEFSFGFESSKHDSPWYVLVGTIAIPLSIFLAGFLWEFHRASKIGLPQP